MAAPLHRVVFLGSKQSGYEALKCVHAIDPSRIAAVVTLDDSADTRSVLGRFEAFCAEYAIEFHVAANRKHSESLLRELSPDFVLVMGWYWIISRATLDASRHGFAGVHYSLLPKYRGGSPLVWAMINGEQETGLSLFSFTDGLDDGDLWAQCREPIGPEDSIGDLLSRLQERTLETLRDVYPGILDGTRRPQPQGAVEATYCAVREEDDGLISWQWPARRVVDFVRAQSHPYPGAFTHFRGERLRIWKARSGSETFYGVPGQVVKVTDAAVWVIAGDNRAVLVEVVGPADATGPARDVLKSIRIRLA